MYKKPKPMQNRREFLKASSKAFLGFTILKSYGLRAAPSDRLRIAHIGVNGMGSSHIKAFAALPDVEIAALCDVDSQNLNKASGFLAGINPDLKPQVYDDFRRILDRKDIDAISCATPDHWHAQIAIMAFQAGKDVYGEKPLSYTVKEGQLMLKSMQKYDRVFQLGTQIHAGANYHRVAEIIQSGFLGKVITIRLWKTGQPPLLTASPNPTVPSTLNYDFWLGPAPYEAYKPEHVHFNYRYFLNYSGGVFQDFWCHIADIAFWAASPQNLRSVQTRGEKADGIGNTPKWIEADFKFDNLDLFWTSTPPNVPGAEKRQIGAFFECEKGTLICDYITHQVTVNGEEVKDLSAVPQTIVRSKGHHQNFVEAAKSRTQPQSNLAYARLMTQPMHLALISWRLGRGLNWNPSKEKFINDKEANSYLNRKYRKAYDWI
jgi:predicted dehydrogenase